MKNRRALAALLPLAALALIVSGCSSDEGSKANGKVVTVTMTDNAFSPSTLDVKKGETVSFRFKNDGKVVHEAIIGDDAAQLAHEKEMMAEADSDSAPASDADHMAGAHDKGMASEEVRVDPGKTADLEHTFSKSGTQIIGCHEPGHYKAGMKATVTVT